jgi:serine/threonine protein kinase
LYFSNGKPKLEKQTERRSNPNFFFASMPKYIYFFLSFFLDSNARVTDHITFFVVLTDVLMVKKEGDISIKICDFGLATFLNDTQPIYKNCGTTGYSAPEVLSKLPYGKPCDMWSLGVILYAMLHGEFLTHRQKSNKHFSKKKFAILSTNPGYLPFHSESTAEMKQKILVGEFRFSRRTSMSESVKSLIKDLLNMSPSKRPTIQAVRCHPWFSNP